MPFLPVVVAPPSFSGGRRYVHVIGATVFIDDRTADEEWNQHVVGIIDDDLWVAVDVPVDAADPSFGAALDLRTLSARVSDDEWLAAGRAVQIAEWARTHRYCGRCGTPTEPVPDERAMRCPACELLAFPRLAPAMITLITRGPDGPEQEVLLARGVHWTVPMYSCLAGFVEPGESLESAVIREVHEEVGLTVTNPRYVGSQPWPFPHSLMIGFQADYESGDIVCDPSEIADAQWFHRDALPMIPPGISIARRMIDTWVESAR